MVFQHFFVVLRGFRGQSKGVGEELAVIDEGGQDGAHALRDL